MTLYLFCLFGSRLSYFISLHCTLTRYTLFKQRITKGQKKKRGHLLDRKLVARCHQRGARKDPVSRPQPAGK